MAAKEISADAAAAALSSQLHDIFTLKVEQRTATEDFPLWKRCFRFTPDWA